MTKQNIHREQSASSLRGKEKRKSRSIFMMSCKCLFVLVPVALAIVFATQSFAYPFHAQCTINWEFDSSCKNVSTEIQTQIKKWAGDENCKQGGEKCLYKIVSVSENTLKATHETPAKHYVDELTFTLSAKSSGGCAVEGYSRSKIIYAVLDYGTNYCNLENLITGSELDKDPGYSESTSDSVCTQYTSANCTIY